MNADVYDLDAALGDERVLVVGQGDVIAVPDADRPAWTGDDDGYDYQEPS